MAWEDVWAVLKWVLAVLAAGFVGQFGRVLAMRIIERRQQTSDHEQQDALASSHRGRVEHGDPQNREDERATKATAKLEKKRAKAASKAAKKGANDESS
ncbi:hypothetical protein JW848_04875 [Candidatus Bipolaricaulota bacterium]|nr:hypothetical protein [Candidatus Bipolaricaulota bacterium]